MIGNRTIATNPSPQITPHTPECDANPQSCSLLHDMEAPSDAALVAQVIAGDAEAFALLLRRYRDAHARFATRMLGNRDDADEALQSAFLRAFRSLAKCAEPERFGAWLYRIVINECRTLAARRAHRERSLVRDPATLGTLAERDDPVGSDALDRKSTRLSSSHLVISYAVFCVK